MSPFGRTDRWNGGGGVANPLSSTSSLGGDAVTFLLVSVAGVCVCVCLRLFWGRWGLWTAAGAEKRNFNGVESAGRGPYLRSGGERHLAQ